MPSMISFRRSCCRCENGRDERRERLRHRVLRVAGEQVARPRCATTRAWCARRCASRSLVDDVVDLAAERVERGDRAPPLAAAGRGSCSRSSSRSPRPSAGSTRRASYGCSSDTREDAGQSNRVEHRPVAEHVAAARLDLVEDAQRRPAPCADLEAERPGSARPSGAPVEQQRARALDLERHQRAPALVAARARAMCASVDAEARASRPAAGRCGPCA